MGRWAHDLEKHLFYQVPYHRSSQPPLKNNNNKKKQQKTTQQKTQTSGMACGKLSLRTAPCGAGALSHGMWYMH